MAMKSVLELCVYKTPFGTSGHICETFTIKMFTENIYHQVQVLLTICEKFPLENNHATS